LVFGLWRNAHQRASTLWGIPKYAIDANGFRWERGCRIRWIEGISSCEATPFGVIGVNPHNMEEEKIVKYDLYQAGF
jgi:hypothetical protein